MIKLKEVIESSPGFKQMQRELSQAAREVQAKRKAEYESNSEVQRFRSRSKDENTRAAIEKMVEKRKQFNDFKSGRDTTEAQAREDTMKLLKRKLGNDV